ncbi:MAG: MFS transporter, partial [Rhodothermales bacterium]
KKPTCIISQSISIIGYVLFWFLFVPGKPHLFLWALPFHSFGIGGLFTIMMSMTADVCDIDEYNTGYRREGTLGAVYWWMTKFGQAFAGLLSGVIMALVGFDAAQVTSEAMTGLRIVYSVLPMAASSWPLPSCGAMTSRRRRRMPFAQHFKRAGGHSIRLRQTSRKT